MWLFASNGYLTDAWIHDNTSYDGGGLTVLYAYLELTDVLVEGNAIVNNGGGLYLLSSGAYAYGSTAFQSNTAPAGGGAYLVDSVLNGGLLAGNTADIGGGAALELWSLPSALEGVSIDGNSAGEGGGIFALGTATVQGGSITGNDATIGGGAFSDAGVAGGSFDVTFDGTEIADNVAGASGGGIRATRAAVTITGGRVVRNTGAEGGGAAVSDGGSVSSEATDWGTDGDDNLPSDVLAGSTEVVGYGADATFGCSEAGCTPAP